MQVEVGPLVVELQALPAGQSEQAVAPAVATNDPGVQLLGAADVEMQATPAVQFVHTVAAW